MQGESSLWLQPLTSLSRTKTDTDDLLQTFRYTVTVCTDKSLERTPFKWYHYHIGEIVFACHTSTFI